MRLPALILVLGFLSAACDSRAPVAGDNLALGAPLPSFELVDLQGERHHLADYRGRWVVLNIWATWCAPCRWEMPSLQRLSLSLDPAQFAVVGLSVDEDDHVVREYLIDKKISFPNHIDAGGSVATNLLGVPVFPYTLILDPEGVLRHRVTGPRQWDADKVLEAFKQARQGAPGALQAL